MTTDNETQTPPSPNTSSPKKDSNTSKKDVVLSPSSPYYVHPVDNPTTVIFTPLLTSDNYCIWERGVRKSLSAKAKLGYIDGSVTKPEDPIDLLHWTRADDLENNSVAIYFTHLKTLWDQLDSFRPLVPCICGAGKDFVDHHNQDRSMEFLQGLHDRFSTLRSQCFLTELMPSAAKIYNLVRQEEEQQGIKSSSSIPQVDSAALNVYRSDSNRSQQHSFHNPGNGNNNNKCLRPFCDYCTKHGHTRQTCWKLNGYPSSPPKPRNQSQPSYAAAVAPAHHAVEHMPAAPAISAAQYARLMTLLDPDNAGNNIASYANCAGPSHENGDWME
ncbi:uncharacterized protein LOC113274224 [Papaver somniferum]|uniref:uncharacterized protein LOC113274224 n=1 Tax=Papaver somniferum TaxID=3469 RepID=UPI000E7026E5|nr:uncharacterized protein LOC113274224 [Papaver somniferum]